MQQLNREFRGKSSSSVSGQRRPSKEAKRSIVTRRLNIFLLASLFIVCGGASPDQGPPFRGVALHVGQIDSPAIYEKAVDEIAALGADTVEFALEFRQENAASASVYIDVRLSPSADKLAGLIQYAKGRKLRVVLMPVMLLEKIHGTEWHGVINPADWGEWFESYREALGYYARAAEAGRADVLVVGAELVSSERFKDEWVHTIADARRLFHGLLTYSANWDHYRKVPFWDHLDLVATNSYYKLGENRDVTVEQIVATWKRIQDDFLPWVREQHKPFIFTELGWFSAANAANEPWDYTKDELPIDIDLQRKLYQAFFEAWNGVPEMAGYMIWEWTPTNRGGLNDRTYTPQGKPAEHVLRQAFAQPRWKVADQK